MEDYVERTKMVMKVPGKPEALLDAANLHKVLSYSEQHRTVISQAFKKAFPEQWPDVRQAEDAFYEALFRLMQDRNTRSQVLDALHALVMRKNKSHWKEVLFLPLRVALQGLNSCPDREAAEAALEQDKKDLSRVWELLAHEGHPEYGWWHQWLLFIYKTVAERSEEATGKAELSDPQAIENEWREALEEVGRHVAEAIASPPSEDLAGWFKEAAEHLEKLAQNYAKLTNRSEMIQHCMEVLDELDAAELPSIAEQTSRAREILAGDAVPHHLLAEWAERLQRTGQALREAQAREAGHRAAIETALSRGDYADIMLHSPQAESAKDELHTLRADLAALVAALGAPSCGKGAGPDLTASGSPTQEEGGKSENDAEAVPVAPTVDRQESADTHEETAGAEATGDQTSLSRDDGASGLVDSQVTNPSTRVSPAVATGKQAGMPAKPEGGAKAASLSEREMPGGQSPAHDKATPGGELPRWSAQVSAHEVANELLSCGEAQRVQTARALAWALVRDGRIPLAYHIARVAAEVLPPEPEDIRPEPLRAIHLGGYLTSIAGEEVVEIGETLRPLYEIDFADGALRSQRPLILMTYAAVLRPALVAPHTSGAEGLLRGLPLDESLSALHALREQILAPGFRYQAMLHLEPGSYLDELRGRAREWGETNRLHNFKYEPATWVWHYLLEREQTLGSALAIIVDGGPADLGRARGLLQAFESRTAAEKMIHQADLAVRERKASRKPIEAGPLRDMVKRSTELVDFLAKWVEAIGEHARTSQGPGREAALRADKERLLGNLDRALGQIESLQETADLVGNAAVACLVKVLRDVRGRLNGTVAGTLTPSAWWRSLNGVLLPGESAMLVGDRWEPDLERASDPLLALAELVAPPDWEASFDAANRGCDHVRTAQILDWLRHEDEADGLLDSLERRREEGLRRCRKDLEVDLDRARDEVERAASLGYLGEDDRSRLVATIEAANSHSRENLGQAKRRVWAVLEELKRLRDREVNGIRQRIEESEVSRTDPEAYRRVLELLDVGDILTASEYAALLENGQSIPGPAERRDPFKDEFFPGFVERLPKELGNRGGQIRDIPDDIAHGAQVGPVDMRHVPGAQARSAAEMLRAWLLLKARRPQVHDNLQLFLERLGLSAVEVARVAEEGRDAREQVFDVSARTISDRDICLVPRYGSHAKGQYRVLCVWDRPSEEEVLASAQARSGGRAVIVLYLGQLTVKRRRDLAFRSRERSQTVLVVDETLVYFLCAERGSRPATMFDCALPFTVAQPYVTTSSDVPAELFFGRRSEVQNVFDQAGTNLIYGGRQLGKTALLRAVVRHFHDPKRGSIVAWVDLKERQIGLSEPADAVWPAIDRELVRQGVLPNARRGPEGTAEAVTRWLDAAPERRVVMLLDEADAFLAQDARDAHFRTVGTLKGLMERTGRRFKVVFAGLHNVQRTSRDVNTPLAHFGKPVCIGPLLANGEAREAYQLVERPLRQLGFRFESPALVNRILAQTNYYPNLIQIVCDHLLDYLQDVGSARFDPATSPPYVITREQVEAVFQSRDLQQTIRSRFQITLDLDNRYQVVALSIALETRQREETGDGEADGFDPEWIRREGLTWWPQGFPDRSYDAFRALLDEMVGLGVLRRAGPELRSYALRSPAIAGLLGSPGEIEQALLEVSEKAPPELYQAASYRRFRRGDPWVRSPLTGQQESEVLADKEGVLLLFGTVLAGLAWVVPFLREMVADKDYVKLTLIEGLQDLKGFEARLRDALDTSGKMEGTHHLLVVPHTEPWTQAWVDRATVKITRHRSTRSFNRILFVGDTRDAWDWLSAGELNGSGAVSTFTLTPWAESFVGQWARDASFGPLNKGDLGTWGEAIGWWGGLLVPLGEELKAVPAAWQRTFETYRQRLPETLHRILCEDLPPELAYPLQVLARYGEPLSEVEWLELLKGPDAKPDPAWLRRLIHWADLLSLLTPVEGGAWAIDRVVSRALVG